MEGSGTGIGRIDCYEDMFKEITRKLYGDDTDQRSTSVQNEFETVTFKTEEESENGTDGSDDGNWVIEEEPLKGSNGSRVAAYHVGKSTWKCYECCELITGIPREVAEHFMELHSPDSRNRHHSSRKDYMQVELKQEDVIAYLERVRERAERIAPPLRRTQETQTVPATLLPVSSTFLLQEIPSVTQQQQIHQQSNMGPTNASPSGTKRYSCPVCSYSTDRRDLFTRHENIHRSDKPFECYVCEKPFNRADHVKKHFLRMHRELQYDLARIRRPGGQSPGSAQRNLQQNTSPANGNATQQNIYPTGFNNNTRMQIQPTPGSSTAVYQPSAVTNTNLVQPEVNRRVQNGGCNSKSHVKGGQKSQSERKYSCDFCSWTGVDNWCLKRHLNTHLKPYACSLCEYKAARSERLTTHVLKVHNRRQCSRCTFLAEDAAQLQAHQLHVHRVSGGNASTTVASTPVVTTPPQPQNNRLQPLHPMGGRPPPGPPVFPAPAPAIAQPSTVLPTSQMLGHEMVIFPTATSPTASSPREEAFCPDDRGTKSFSNGLETIRIDGKVDANDNNFTCSDFLAFVEAMRQVYKDKTHVSELLSSYVSMSLEARSNWSTCSTQSMQHSPVEEYYDEYMNRSSSESRSETEFALEDYSIDVNESIKLKRKNQERHNTRKQKKPRKVCASNSDDEDAALNANDVTEVRATASFLVKPIENGVAKDVSMETFQQSEEAEKVKEQSSERQ